jgi:hypothetical protein
MRGLELQGYGMGNVSPGKRHRISGSEGNDEKAT